MARPLAFFDVDGTLLKGDCGVLFARWCALRGMLTRPEWMAMGGWMVRSLLGGVGLREVAEAKRLALAFRARLGDELTDRLVERCFIEVMQPRKQVAVCAEVTRLKGEAEIFLITANLREFALRWGKELGVPAENCLGVEGVRREGRLTGELTCAIPIGEERARIMTTLIAQRGSERSQCWAFGDSHFDEPMLRLVGHPHVVAPSRSLMRIARRERWSIIE